MVWIEFLALSLFVFMGLSLALSMNKHFRAKRGALSRYLCLSDINILLIASLGLGFSQVFIPNLSLILALFCLLFSLLVWLDALLFIQYRIEINRQTLAWFFTGSKGLAKGIKHLLAGFNKYFYARFIPIFVLLTLLPCFYLIELRVYMWLMNTLLLMSIIVFKPVKSSYINYALIFSLSLLSYQYLSPLINANWLKLQEGLLSISAFIMLVFLGSVFVFNILRTVLVSHHCFLSTPSLLPNIVLNDNFIVNDKVKLETKHINILNRLSPGPEQGKLNKSPFFASCKNANIILITVESLGAYVEPYMQDGVRSLLAQKLKNKSWLSKQHFSLCPNTTVATNQIYTGAYSNNPYNKDESVFFGAEPLHIKHLKKSGYKTLFLDSANIHLYDYQKLLNRIGFDKIWGTADIPSNGLVADYRLWNMVDPIVEEVAEQPFFLHVINDQSHMPYEVIDKKKFSRHKGSSQKSLYMNALEEVDYILDSFLSKLSERLDLSNTMIVFTGDHGESFGEYGYSFHSNSVITAQVQVPFMLTHPNLDAKEIEHSCHFDLFPTFFDLLGIEIDYQRLGLSLGNDDREKSYFFHSATLKGNTPANFSLLLDDEVLWVDRLFGQSRHWQYREREHKKINTAESYISAVLAKVLQDKKLIN